MVEGAYPYVTGGVASWLQELIISLPEVRFSIVAIKANASDQLWRTVPPDNVVEIVEAPLSREWVSRSRCRPAVATRIGKLLMAFLHDGRFDQFQELAKCLADLPANVSAQSLMATPEVFAILSDHYSANLPTSSFHHYFWAMQILLGGLLAVFEAPLPRAKVYHTLSTGYAGLLAARAAIETGRPAFVTEHGIYLLERKIEIMMVDWLGDQTESGLAFERDCTDLTDLWSRAFESYSRACYDACDPIVSLYGANREVQKRLGASPERLRVIPNGIRPERFAQVARHTDPDHPLIALIGRVVPIKDIKTFIRAAALIHAQAPEVRFAVLGPEDEDAGYSDECKGLVEQLGLGEVFAFAGRVDVVEWLPRIDLLVLTSLSEAQPLVILEAGACGIPAVAPDVGSCREMLEGSGGPVRAGGIITALVDPDATASAILRLVRQPELRTGMGKVLQDRVLTSYDWAGIVEQYGKLYSELAEKTTTTSPLSQHTISSSSPGGFSR
ncbi:MAG: GT4 family glycosyltransferase PelF [Novosphingobium sp.]